MSKNVNLYLLFLLVGLLVSIMIIANGGTL